MKKSMSIDSLLTYFASFFCKPLYFTPFFVPMLILFIAISNCIHILHFLSVASFQYISPFSTYTFILAFFGMLAFLTSAFVSNRVVETNDRAINSSARLFYGLLFALYPLVLFDGLPSWIYTVGFYYSLGCLCYYACVELYRMHTAMIFYHLVMILLLLLANISFKDFVPLILPPSSALSTSSTWFRTAAEAALVDSAACLMWVMPAMQMLTFLVSCIYWSIILCVPMPHMTPVQVSAALNGLVLVGISGMAFIGGFMYMLLLACVLSVTTIVTPLILKGAFLVYCAALLVITGMGVLIMVVLVVDAVSKRITVERETNVRFESLKAAGL